MAPTAPLRNATRAPAAPRAVGPGGDKTLALLLHHPITRLEGRLLAQTRLLRLLVLVLAALLGLLLLATIGLAHKPPLTFWVPLRAADLPEPELGRARAVALENEVGRPHPAEIEWLARTFATQLATVNPYSFRQRSSWLMENATADLADKLRVGLKQAEWLRDLHEQGLIVDVAVEYSRALLVDRPPYTAEVQLVQSSPNAPLKRRLNFTFNLVPAERTVTNPTPLLVADVIRNALPSEPSDAARTPEKE